MGTFVEGNAQEGVQIVVDHHLHLIQQLQIRADECDGPSLGVQVEGGVGVRPNDGVVLFESRHVRQFGAGGTDGELKEYLIKETQMISFIYH